VVLALALAVAGMGVASPARLPRAAGSDTKRAAAESNPATPGKDRNGDRLPPGAVARLGTTRFRLIGRPQALACSPDGRWLVTHEGKTIFLLDAATGKRGREFRGHTGTVLCLAYSPDGKAIASGAAGHSFRVWDVVTGRELHRLQGGPAKRTTGYSPFGHVFFTPDGKSLVTHGADNLVRLWDLANGRERRRFTGDQDLVWAVALARDGKTLAALVTPPGADGKTAPDEVRVWEVATGKRIRQWPAPPDQAVRAFSPDLDVLITRPGTKPPYVLTVWDMATGKARHTIPEQACNVSYSADGKQLWALGDFAASCWDIASGKGLRHFKLPRPYDLTHTALMPDGRTLVVWGWRQIIQFYDTTSGKERRRYGGHEWGIRALAFSPDAKVLASGATEDVRLWDVGGRKELRRLELDRSQGWPDWVEGLAFFPDGKRLLAGTANHGLHLWDVSADPTPARRVAGTGSAGTPILSPDGKWLLVCNRNHGLAEFTVLDAQSWKPRREWRMAGKHLWALAVSPDGRVVAASVGGDGQDALLRWEAATGQVQPLPGKQAHHISALAYSADGRFLATVERHETTRLWETATGALRAVIDVNSSNAVLALSPDNRFLALADAGRDERAAKGSTTDKRDRNKVCLVDLATGKVVRRFAGHRGGATALAFSPEGKLLASGGYDTTVLLWEMVAAAAKITPPDPAEFEALWADLAGADGLKAHRAVWALTTAPGRSVPWLKKRLRPVAEPDPKQVARLLAELDNPRARLRESASRQLEALEDRAGPALRRALKEAGSLEFRRRVELLLAKLDEPVQLPEMRRALRATEALEHMATPEARALLRELAGGAAEARLTREARAALGRLGKHGVAAP
jgi:WD40 repeat protein